MSENLIHLLKVPSVSANMTHRGPFPFYIKIKSSPIIGFKYIFNDWWMVCTVFTVKSLTEKTEIFGQRYPPFSSDSIFRKRRVVALFTRFQFSVVGWSFFDCRHPLSVSVKCPSNYKVKKVDYVHNKEKILFTKSCLNVHRIKSFHFVS